MIYLDNAATTRTKPPQVIEAVVTAMTTMGNASRGAHESALQASRGVYDTRCKLARLFGFSRPERVVFTANSTQALNMAIRGTLQVGDHVISTDLEHNSVLRPLHLMEDEGTITVDFVPADRQGQVDYDDFERLIRPETRAIICTHASNLTGEVLDIGRIGALAKERGLLFIVDASQTAGCLPIDMETMSIDILCFTGHKGLMGPQGTGGLCVAEGVEVRPWAVGGSGVQTYRRQHPEEYPTRLEAGTLNSHGILGLSAALDFLKQTGVETIAAHERALMERFCRSISQVEGVTVYGNFDPDHPRTAVVALNIWDYDSGEVSDVLSQDYDIATRPGAHCAPRMHRALGTEEQGAVRFSFSWYNTEDEVDAAAAAVRELAEK